MSTLHFPTDHGPTFSFDINTDFEWTKGEDGRLIGRIQRSERALKIIKCLYDMMKSGKHLVNSGILGLANIEKIGPWEGVKRGEGYCEIVIRKRVEKAPSQPSLVNSDLQRFIDEGWTFTLRPDGQASLQKFIDHGY